MAAAFTETEGTGHRANRSTRDCTPSIPAQSRPRPRDKEDVTAANAQDRRRASTSQRPNYQLLNFNSDVLRDEPQRS